MNKSRGLLLDRCCALLAVVATISGCNALDSEPLQTLRDSATTYNNLADALAGVRDAPSAEASLALVEQRYVEACDLLKRITAMESRLKTARVSQATADEVTADIQRGSRRLAQEVDRLNHTPGLPRAFWKVVKKYSFELVELGAGTGYVAIPPETIRFMREVHGLYEQYPFEEVANVELKNVYGNRTGAATDAVQKLAPGARLCRLITPGSVIVFLAPVKDFRGFARQLGLGRVAYEDASRQVIEIEVSMEKVPDPEFERVQRASRQRMQEAQNTFARAHAARQRENEGPDPGDPDYYEKMADRMLSNNLLHQNQAIEAMLRVEPADVKSAAARKKIARAFKKLAEGKHSLHGEEVVRALAKWGGTYSVPILVKMLGTSFCPHEETVLQVLADFKDARAAPAFVKRLGSYRYGELVYNGLVAMGSDAEDAVLMAATSDDRKVCIAVLSLLGEIGTDKCHELLGRVQQSRNREYRLLAIAAAQKINRRKLAAKSNANGE